MKITREVSRDIAREVKDDDKYVIVFILQPPNYQRIRISIDKDIDQYNPVYYKDELSSKKVILPITSREIRMNTHKHTIKEISDYVYKMANFQIKELRESEVREI